MNRPKWHELFAIEATVCEKCGHSEGDHYWNGGGNPAQSGYDQCRKEGCKCIDYDQNKDFVTEIVGYDENAIKIINEAMAEQKRLILEAGEELNKEEFIEAHDNDTHRYQIPRSKREEWYKWCEIGEKDSEDPRAWDVPEWAERIDGMPTTDVRPYNQALTDYQERIKQLLET